MLATQLSTTSPATTVYYKRVQVVSSAVHLPCAMERVLVGHRLHLSKDYTMSSMATFYTCQKKKKNFTSFGQDGAL